MGNVSNAVIQFLASSKTRVAILGLLVLSTGVFTTIYLVNQRQDIRQRAAWDTGGFCIQNSQCTSGKCEGVQYDQQGNLIGAGTCAAGGSTPTPTTSTGGGSSTSCNSCLSQGKEYYCPPSFRSRQTTGTCSNTNTGSCTKCQAAPTPEPSNSPTPSPQPSNSPTPTLSPTPTTDPACAGSTNKANGCACNINVHCASGFCAQTGGATGICQDNTTQLTCDPNSDGVINILDFQWWKDEMFGVRTTKESDCFNPDGVVNILDFQVWKDIAISKIKQPF